MKEQADETHPTSLKRNLGTRDAVVIGLGSMMGAGVFAAFGPAAAAAGTGLLLGLAVAAMVAFCNATASAQLAAIYPTSGGTYVYGRARLGPWWGFTAGWGFVVGKTASCAAMALTFAAYAVPGPQWAQRLLAVVAVIGLAAFNYRGISKTAMLARVLVAATLVCLATVVVVVVAGDKASARGLGGWTDLVDGGIHGILQSAGLLFFAFAGYARMATMGEEVREPRRTIPRAIMIALLLAVVVYATVGAAALFAAGPDRLADSSAPLVAAVEAAGAGDIAPVVRTGAVLASLGALLSLIAGVGRTTLAMARNKDLPTWLAAIHPRYQVPHHAEMGLAAVVSVLVLTSDLRGVIGFSSFGVLVYYAIANAAAFTQPAEDRSWPRWLQVAGIAGCLVLIATLPIASVVVGLAIVIVGLGGRALILRNHSTTQPNDRKGISP